jgi:hypothetical protein
MIPAGKKIHPSWFLVGPLYLAFTLLASFFIVLLWGDVTYQLLDFWLR